MLGQGLRDTGLSAAEGSRNSAGSTQDGGEHSIENSLTSDQWHISCQLLNNRSGLSDWPLVTHRVFGLLSFELEFQHLLMDVVLSRWRNIGDLSSALGWDKDAVLREETVLIDAGEDVTLTEDVTLLDGADGLELPQFGRI